MITYTITIEELQPGCIAMDSNPSATNETELEKLAAGRVNEGLITVLGAVMRDVRGDAPFTEMIGSSPSIHKAIETTKQRIREGRKP